jgi:hypothetical protein
MISEVIVSQSFTIGIGLYTLRYTRPEYAFLHEVQQSQQKSPASTVQRASCARPYSWYACHARAIAQQYQRFLAAATTDNTRRTYRSTIRHFQAWGGLLPCDEAALIRDLLTFAQVLKART